MKRYKNIFEAIENDDIVAVKSFLPDQLEARNEDGRTPLHWACHFSFGIQMSIVKLLLKYGADVEAKDKLCQTPFHKVCIIGHFKTALLLLNYGSNIEAKDKHGFTPLHYACYYENPDISELLVKRGSDPYALNDYGRSALDYNKELIIKDEYGKELQHNQILMQLRAEYYNQHELKASERTAALSSGWEMEI